MPADRDFALVARRLTVQRVEALGKQLERALTDRSADAVHDLRVAARRLVSTIDCFRNVQQGSHIRVLRKRVKAILRAGREVRDRDIALELAARAALDSRSSVVANLEMQRAEAADALLDRIDRKRYGRFAEKWKAKLGPGCHGSRCQIR